MNGLYAEIAQNTIQRFLAARMPAPGARAEPRFKPRRPPAKGRLFGNVSTFDCPADDSPQEFLIASPRPRNRCGSRCSFFLRSCLRKAVIAAHKRGVKVRVMLNPVRRDGTGENIATSRALQAAGVEVMDSNPKFPVTHEKSMVVDSRIAFINSLNWDTENLEETRDYSIRTRHAHEVEEVMDGFEADWHRHHFDPGEGAHMIWAVGNARERIAGCIDGAKHSLCLQHERYQDPVILERLVRAKMRGVDVRVMARAPHT